MVRGFLVRGVTLSKRWFNITKPVRFDTFRGKGIFTASRNDDRSPASQDSMFGGGHRKGVDGKDWIENVLNPRVPQREFVIVLTPTIYLSKIARRKGKNLYRSCWSEL